MKRLLAIITFSFSVMAHIHGQDALLIIDIQDFYYPGGRSELAEPVKAGNNAALLLGRFRKEGKLVVHIRHNAEPGGNINVAVAPREGEKVISKNDVNAFKGTDLLEYLRSNNISTLVICGMQTHMCVEAAVRAGSDYGFKVVLVHDACTTRDLKFGEIKTGWQEVHYSTLATLKSYSTIVSTDEYLGK